MKHRHALGWSALAIATLTGCQQQPDAPNAAAAQPASATRPASDYLSQPLVKDIYTACLLYTSPSPRDS